MMEAQLRLAVFIVHFGLVFVHPYNGNGYQFQGLSTSNTKNNLEKKHISVKTLQNEVSESQHIFDAMKNELQKAQNMNIQKRNLYERSNIFQKNVIRKREMDNQLNNPTTRSSINQTELEEMFVDHFSDNYTTFKDWQPIKDWYMEEDEPKLRKFCANAHRKSGKGDLDINVVVMRPRYLVFERYQPKRVHMVAYGVANPEARNPDIRYWHTPEGFHWYITEGLRSDCVFYTTIPNTTVATFKLIDHVCGVEIPK